VAIGILGTIGGISITLIYKENWWEYILVYFLILITFYESYYLPFVGNSPYNRYIYREEFVIVPSIFISIMIGVLIIKGVLLLITNKRNKRGK
jgi:hypothetical protein